jgi:hypothetical protein
MFSELQKTADKPGPGKAQAQPAAAPAAKPAEARPTTAAAPKPAEAKADPAPAAASTEPTAAPVEDPKKGKANPWKLVDEYKAKALAAETQLAEANKRAIPEADWKKTHETLAEREKRLTELEQEIRYVNYSKSEEFKTKYQQPYEKQWQRTMAELGELTVETADGGTRPLAANDILDLVNAPLGKAHELAVERFGDLAPEVMAHRKEIRKLFDEQATALEEARKSGAEREKNITEQSQRQFSEVSTKIRDIWSKANEEVTVDPKYGTYFTPVDGDEQGNQRLAKGFELADRAFSENPLAPGLSAEQRESIVRRHAAVRNRAAAFGRLVYQNTQSQQRIAALEKELAEYKGTEPARNGSQPAVTPSKAQPGMSRIREGLAKIAH